MIYQITLILFALLSFSCFASSRVLIADNKTHFQSNNFYVLNKTIKGIDKAKDCRRNIKAIVCLVDPAKPEQGSQERPCLKGSEKYAPHFERLYDNYPTPFQKIFCSLNIIYIEKQFRGTAYAGTVIDEQGNLNGAMMGVRKSAIDENMNLTHWASWKEQLSFGGNKDDYQVKQDLPLVSTTSNNSVNDFLFFLVAHEFGHIFDFANKVNEFTNCESDLDGECDTPKAGSWSELSWISNKKVLSKDDFHKRESLCFYSCQNTFIPKSETLQLYNELYLSSFISTYAATNPWDDFAESLAYVTMDNFLKSTYSISFRGEVFDTKLKLQKPVFAEKRAFIIEFLNKRDIVYP